MQEKIILEFSIILFGSLAVSLFMKLIKQPVMIGYIITGLIIGPSLLDLTHSSDQVSMIFSQLGIAFLLFMVGLGINPQSVKESGKTAAITGFSQVILTCIAAFLVTTALGFQWMEALFVSIGVSFSSTIVILKLMTEKRDTESLYGRISIGFLIVQDFIAMLILMCVSSFSKGGDPLITTGLIIGKSAILGTALYFISTKVFPPFMKTIARNQEILLVFSLSWCMALASIFYLLDFSIEIGALIAGISLSLSPYRYEISAKMKPLRDFFVMLFFVLLGSHLDFSNIIQHLPGIISLTGLVILINPVIVMLVMKQLGYTKNTSFLAGLNVTQVSEFSLILLALGVKMGYIQDQTLSLLTFVSIFTIIISTYLITNNEKLYAFLEPYLGIFEKKHSIKNSAESERPAEGHQIILLGYSKLGSELLEGLSSFSKDHLIVDYDPRNISHLQKKKIDCIYGDISNAQIFDEIHVEKAKMIISTVKHFDTNILIAHKIRDLNPEAILIGVAHHIDEAIKLYEGGFNYVIMPNYIGGHHTAGLISQIGFNGKEFIKRKQEHLGKLLLKKQTSASHR